MHAHPKGGKARIRDAHCLCQSLIVAPLFPCFQLASLSVPSCVGRWAAEADMKARCGNLGWCSTVCWTIGTRLLTGGIEN